jgi:hypothetical protein
MRFETPLGLFSTLWALAACLHDLEQHPLDGLLLYPWAIVLLLKPERIWAIATFALVHAALLSLHLPSMANHSVLALLVDGCLLIGCWRARRSAPIDRGRQLWQSVQGPIRATVAVIYALTILHKLNTSFFDWQVSCAVTQVAKMFRMHGFQPPADMSVFAFNIYLTLIFELAIVVLLLWPRFSHLGALIGLVFHTGLAWARFFDFATVVLSLYLFFLPWERVEANMQRIPRWAGACFAIGLVLLSATSFFFHEIRESPFIVGGPDMSLQADTLICLFWTLMVWPILLPVFSRGAGSYRHGWTGAALAWIVPVVALCNGLTSYLGLKTVANYSMFSNLRTEGGMTNHLLIPPGRFFVAGYQDDLVRVEAFEGVRPRGAPWWIRLAGGRRIRPRWLSEGPGVRVPFAELRRTVQLWKAAGFVQVSISYERQGRRHQWADAFSDPELMLPMPLWERKLMAFRAVQDDGEPCTCRW